jgi:hypothetical protein
VAAILEQMLGMRFLKIAASDLIAGNLRRNRKHRHPVPLAIEQAVDEMKIARSATPRAHCDLAGEVGLRSGGKRGGLFMPHMQPFNLLGSPDHVGQPVQ